MRVFVYEYLSSGAASESALSLQSEGWAMLAAVLEDLARCPGVQVTTLLSANSNSPPNWPDNVVLHRVQPEGEEARFRALAAEADKSLVIAPEFDDILSQRSRWVEESGGRLLGSSAGAIHLASDKLALLHLWQKHGVPTAELARSFPLVCKPRFGAGSQATFLVHDAAELERARGQAQAEGWTGELIEQAYKPGLAVSVAFLGAEGRLHALPAVEQRLSTDGRFRYQGGRLPLSPSLDRRARQLAERAVRPVEGLHGWFGVDLVLGDAADGSGDVAVEINPRLTTSYVGLRRLARFNLAEALLTVATGACADAGCPPPCGQWRSDPIVFASDGQILKPPRENPGVS